VLKNHSLLLAIEETCQKEDLPRLKSDWVNRDKFITVENSFFSVSRGLERRRRLENGIRSRAHSKRATYKKQKQSSNQTAES